LCLEDCEQQQQQYGKPIKTISWSGVFVLQEPTGGSGGGGGGEDEQFQQQKRRKIDFLKRLSSLIFEFNQSTKVFGIPLKVILAREKSESGIPKIVEQCTNQIRKCLLFFSCSSF